ncbi:MAG: ADP-ribose pyrophosphatase [Gammaproteobacteria bacterium]|nr:ADP-ribose pyrophosphatase [Gammaproteobacteria bacterium]
MNDASNPVYTNLDPRWERVAIPSFVDINSTTIRHKIFDAMDATAVRAWLRGTQAGEEVSEHVILTLQAFCATTAWAELKTEYDYLKQYRQTWSAAPYPPVFITVDAVVVHDQQVLLIKRKNYPGKGLWALPGGFVDQNETLVDACVRELLEETAINLPAAELKSAIRSRQVFDYPYRSARGRTITEVFYFDLRAPGDLPAISAGDDASAVRWFSLADLDPATLNEDHYFIIRKLTATGPA